MLFCQIRGGGSRRRFLRFRRNLSSLLIFHFQVFLHRDVRTFSSIFPGNISAEPLHVLYTFITQVEIVRFIIHRITLKGWDCKNDLKLLRYDELRVKVSFLSGIWYMVFQWFIQWFFKEKKQVYNRKEPWINFKLTVLNP